MSVTNTANSDKYRTVFSNVPVPESRTRKLDMEVFTSYVKSIVLPDISIQTTEVSIGNTIVNTPVQKYNTELGQMTIEFFADEDLENYKAWFDWLYAIRKGCPTVGAGNIQESIIHQIQVLMLDNEDRMTNKMVFSKCWLLSLSPLTMNFGSSDELLYACTFQFDKFEIIETEETLNN